MGKRKKKGAPAIVPRFLKSAVTIGAIPAFAVACAKPVRPPPPVVAYMAPPEPKDAMPPPVVAAYALDAQPPVQPVVAAYARDAGSAAELHVQPAVVAAYVGNKIPVAADAGVDAAPAKKKKKAPADAALPPPPVVAALVAPPPPVVAAMMPRNDVVPPKKKSPKQ